MQVKLTSHRLCVSMCANMPRLCTFKNQASVYVQLSNLTQRAEKSVRVCNKYVHVTQETCIIAMLNLQYAFD